MSNCNYISSDKLMQIFDKGEKSLTSDISFVLPNFRKKISKNPSLIILPRINYNQSNKYADILKSKLKKNAGLTNN